MTSQTTAIVIWVYGALVLLGGVIGFLKAKSKPSLIAGGVSGAVLLASGWAVWTDKDFGVWVAVMLAIILMMFFAARFMKTKNVMPAGMMSGLSFAVLVALIVRVIQSGSTPW